MPLQAAFSFCFFLQPAAAGVAIFGRTEYTDF
jgi:hypothetical protein